MSSQRGKLKIREILYTSQLLIKSSFKYLSDLFAFKKKMLKHDSDTYHHSPFSLTNTPIHPNAYSVHHHC